jgi:hypothetical protein
MSIGTEVSIDLSENFTLFAPCLYRWHVSKLYHAGTYKLYHAGTYKLYHAGTYNRLPEDKSSGS